MSSASSLRAGLLVPLVLLLAGCGGNTDVTGKVMLDGKPVNSGSVTYHPDTSRGNKDRVLYVGPIDETGQYRLTGGTRTGAPAGWYKVTVNVSVPSRSNDAYSLPRSLINKKFSEPATTPLAIEVKSDASPGAYDLTVNK